MTTDKQPGIAGNSANAVQLTGQLNRRYFLGLGNQRLEGGHHFRSQRAVLIGQAHTILKSEQSVCSWRLIRYDSSCRAHGQRLARTDDVQDFADECCNRTRNRDGLTNLSYRPIPTDIADKAGRKRGRKIIAGRSDLVRHAPHEHENILCANGAIYVCSAFPCVQPIDDYLATPLNPEQDHLVLVRNSPSIFTETGQAR